jgi:hypothetical protein
MVVAYFLLPIVKIYTESDNIFPWQAPLVFSLFEVLEGRKGIFWLPPLGKAALLEDGLTCLVRK